MGIHSSNPTSSKHTMKILISIFVILVVQETFGQKTITTKPKAQSTFQNCNCQCDSDQWTDGTTIKGNCKSQDNNGALFCYISGRALQACGDIQQSSFLPNNNGAFKFYSYEACVTPPRNQCGQQGLIGNNQFGNNQFANQNFGDGDLQKIQQGAAGLGGILGTGVINPGVIGTGVINPGVIGTGVNPNVLGINQGVVNPGFGQGIIGSGILTGSGFGGVRVKTGSGSKGSSDSVSTSGIKTGAA